MISGGTEVDGRRSLISDNSENLLIKDFWLFRLCHYNLRFIYAIINNKSNRCRSVGLRRSKLVNRTRVFERVHLALQERKKTLCLLVFSWVGKTISYGIPNTNLSSNLLVIFWYSIYMIYSLTTSKVFYLLIDCETIDYIKTGQKCIQEPCKYLR